MRVTALDHIVLTVVDIDQSLAFYCDRLGMAPVRVDEWRAGTAPFPSVRVNDHTIIDLFLHPEGGGPNPDHLCLVVEPVDLQEVIRSGEFTVVDAAPRSRYGARGNGESIKVLDPDGICVELRWYDAAA